MRVVAATNQDHNEILDVWEASVRATHAFLAEADVVFYRGLLCGEGGLDSVRLHVLRDAGDRIWGFLGTDGAMIEMLFLHPSVLGQGLGRALMEFAVHKIGVQRVDVNEQNPSALGFYRHFGFEVVGRSALDGCGKPYPLLHLERKSG
ncbi:MAG: GNAT family N-acetyltransferase [Desulfovibrio sp.]